MPIKNYGKGFKFLQKIGYDGKGPPSLQKQGIVEPIQLELVPKKQWTKGLGYSPLWLFGSTPQETLQVDPFNSTNDT